MPAIKPSSIRDLKDRINIVDVVSREVTLKRAGSSFKGLSPFTQEKTPSFFVSPDKGIYKCFSTGAAGDAISFVMETERLSFSEAVETLAERFNVKLEYEDSGRPAEDRSLRQELFDLHELAANFYHEKFHAPTPEGEWIRDYWTNRRQFALEVADDFKIGFAPPDSSELGILVNKKNFSREAIEQCGLFWAKRGTSAAYLGYRFRGRLMIPIRDHQGRIVAFTARQLEITPEDDPAREAKYVNSPETPIFHKGNLLFNLDRARMEVSPDKPFLMVEGQLDAIRCYSVGLKTAVAPQGTGITESQLRMLTRYEPQLLCLLDGDAAGQKAALRMLPLALSQGLETTFIPLSAGEDPDDLLRDGGQAAFQELLAKRKTDPIPFACDSLAPDAQSLSPQAKAKVARELFAIIDKAESTAVKVEFVKEAAAKLGLDERATIHDFARFAKGQAPAKESPAPSEASPTQIATQPKRPDAVKTVERDLLALCMTDEYLGAQVAQLIDPEWIRADIPEGQILNVVLNEYLHDMWNGTDSLNEQLESAELKALAFDIHFEAPEHENPERFANEAIKQLVLKYTARRMSELKLEIGRKAATNDPADFSLLEDLSALAKLRKNPPRVGSSHS